MNERKYSDNGNTGKSNITWFNSDYIHIIIIFPNKNTSKDEFTKATYFKPFYSIAANKQGTKSAQ